MNEKDQATFKNQLLVGMRQLELSISKDQQLQLMTLLQLLLKWNQHFNLTAISELEKMVSYHILDSLSVAPYLSGGSILDFGSGAGFPGIPLACYFPEKHFVLVESVGKKARFIVQVCAELQLKNVEVVAKRIELLSPVQYRFDCIVSRAVCTIQKFIELTRKFSHERTHWLAMKGEFIEEELKELSLPYKAISLNVPGVSSRRQVVIISYSHHLQKKKG